ncbi:MAG TPA: glycosyl hydrolase [Tepidisphaeraceae bacterium]|nr:glycosyl hydrolase [Tepidisphaeraceae bacterium]
MTTRRITLAMAALAGLLVVSPLLAQVNQLQSSFEQPPDDARLMVRWWWFGPSVTKPELEREMKAMKEAGIGGFEVQPTYPLALDNERPGLKNLKFMSPEFLDMLKFTAAKAKELGLRMDLTLGSGWPYGGPMFNDKESTGALQTQVIPVPEGQKSVAVPQMPENRVLMAAFVGKANSGLGGRSGGGRGARGGGAPEADASGLKQATISNGQIELPADAPSPAEVVLFIAGQTAGQNAQPGRAGMQVKRPAYGAEGPVIDHLSASVVDKFIKEIGEPEIEACAPNYPHAIFCDSLEVNGENWTPNMLEEFQKRRGYDLTPLLPALIGNAGPKTSEIRRDWMMTCTELFNEYFNTKFTALAHKYNSKFRIQGYGSPPAALYSYSFVDLPEGEGHTWQGFSTSRWAASASHLLGVPVTSSETFTWLHSPAFRATPLDFKAEADRHVLEGVNQMIVHGWPYTSEGAAYPGWSFYAATAFGPANPWWIVVPDLTKYIQRNSHMMRQGTPANDVLVYLSNSDAWATKGMSSINVTIGNRAGGVAAAALAAGYNVDFCDDQLLEMKGKVEGNAIAFGKTKYRVVALSGPTRVTPATMKTLEAFAKAGGIVVDFGNPPDIAPGYKTSDEDTKTVRDIAQRLFKDAGAPGILLPDDNSFNARFAEEVGKRLAPDVAISPANTEIGSVHRHTDDAEIYFVANTSNQLATVKATFRTGGMQAEQWDALSGKVTPAAVAEKSADKTTVNLTLHPYGSTIIVFTKRTLPPVQMATSSSAQPLDLSTNWTVKYGKDAQPAPLAKLGSWSDEEANKNFSGVATYEKKFDVPADMVKPGVTLTLSFGEAKVEAAASGRGGRFHAEIDAPIRDGAVVYLNGHPVGSVWVPPYSIDVSKELKPGTNDLRVEVGNTAINSMAKTGYPNYNLAGVRAQYTNRFDPQDLNGIAPLPSGLLGPVKLVAGEAQ